MLRQSTLRLSGALRAETSGALHAPIPGFFRTRSAFTILRPTLLPKAPIRILSTQATVPSGLNLKRIWSVGKGDLSVFNAFAAVCGLYIGSAPLDSTVLYVSIGSFLMAYSSQCFNQIMEIEQDKRMIRTQNRPLPAGHMTTNNAVGLGVSSLLLGSAMLAVPFPMSIFSPFSVSLATFLSYVFIYTPLKQKTYLNTHIGAIVGALPPLIGYAATHTSPFSAGILSFVGLMLFWQIPHFYGLAWSYRDDYRKGGFKMIADFDEDGARSRRHVAVSALGMAACVAVMASSQNWGICFPLVTLLFGAQRLPQSLKNSSPFLTQMFQRVSQASASQRLESIKRVFKFFRRDFFWDCYDFMLKPSSQTGHRMFISSIGFLFYFFGFTMLYALWRSTSLEWLHKLHVRWFDRSHTEDSKAAQTPRSN